MVLGVALPGRALISVALCLLPVFAGCPACPRPGAEVQPIVASGPYVHRESGLTLPEVVGGFRRIKLMRYDALARDVSAHYEPVAASRSIVATVYEYPDTPLVSIGSPPDVVEAARAGQAKIDFDSAKSSVVESHPDARLVSETEAVLRFGGKTYPGRAATFEFHGRLAARQEPQPLRSEVQVFSHVADKWTVKYRFSYPRGLETTKELKDFRHGLWR